MPKFHVETETHEEQIEAAYYVAEDGLVTFKDDDHKQVASFAAHRLISVVKDAEAAKISVGQVTVKVAPELDENAMRALVSDINKRARSAAGGNVNF